MTYDVAPVAPDVTYRVCGECGAHCDDPDWISCHECGHVLAEDPPTKRTDMAAIDPTEKTRHVTTYRVVRVNDVEFNSDPHRTWHRTIAGAFKAIADFTRVQSWSQGRWRVVEIPPGEAWDYDGTVMAAVEIGRGVE